MPLPTAIDEKMHEGVYCVVVKTTCPMCKESKIFNVPESKWLDWVYNHKNIQDVFPEMSRDDRECFISGIDGDCWKKIFGGNR